MKIRHGLVAFLILLASSQLLAHGMLEETYPMDGAEMTEPTDRVEVNFEKPMRLMSLELMDAQDNAVEIDFERPSDPATHFQTALPHLSPGTYKVQWKAMGHDGHLMKGNFSFMQH